MQEKNSQKGQEMKFTDAFNRHSDALFRHSFFRVSNRQIAIDLVQEAFTKTWVQITKGEVILNFQSYLYHVLNNLIIDHYRKKKSLSLDSLADVGFDPVGTGAFEIESSAEHEQIMKVLDTLPKSDRDVIVMRYIDGLPVKHIAQVLNESENGVSVKLHRAIKKMKTIFKGNE